MMTNKEAIRLECLKAAATIGGSAAAVVRTAASFEAYVTGCGRAAPCEDAAGEDRSDIDMENDGAVTSMLPDE